MNEAAVKKGTTWAIDPAHSQIQFKVRHMMISTVTGTFDKFHSEVEMDGEDLNSAKVFFEAETASVHTGSADRDTHLRSADFFDAENHPKLTFKASRLEHVADNAWKVTGDLTMRGTARPITLDMEWNGVNKDPWGNMKAGLNLRGKLNRKEFGLNWNAALEAGGVLVSDEVRIECEVQYARTGS
jgi:polyisoprenoid-binding protein YceI